MLICAWEFECFVDFGLFVRFHLLLSRHPSFYPPFPRLSNPQFRVYRFPSCLMHTAAGQCAIIMTSRNKLCARVWYLCVSMVASCVACQVIRRKDLSGRPQQMHINNINTVVAPSSLSSPPPFCLHVFCPLLSALSHPSSLYISLAARLDPV